MISDNQEQGKRWPTLENSYCNCEEADHASKVPIYDLGGND